MECAVAAASIAASMSGIPGLDTGVSLLASTYDMIKNIKVDRRRCQTLYSECTDLRVALQESGEGLEGTSSGAILDEVEGLIRAIEAKAAEWSQYSYLKSFLMQGEIQEGLHVLEQRLRRIGLKFSFKMGANTARSNQEMRNELKSDQTEFRDLLVRLVNDVEDVRRLVTLESPTHPVVEEVMQSLQTELRAPDLKPDHEEAFKKGLWMLHQRTHKLPPLTDLTGTIEVVSKYRVAAGTHNDVYIGLWLSKEKVALRLPRLLPGSRGVHKRFEKDLTIWRKIDHPNIVPLYGVFYQGSDIYSVSPWMDNGMVLNYLAENPSVDYLRIIHQVATGLEYLHKNGIIHGDLRAGNVLVNKNGIACLSDFGMSKLLEDVGHGNTTSPSYNPRWCAPELLEENATTSKHSDIWSLAMVCLEVLTGELPYATIRNDVAIYQLLREGKHPQRPSLPRVSDPIWNLLKKCWARKPNSRPTVLFIRQKFDEIRGISTLQKSPTTLSTAQEVKKRASLLGFRGTVNKRESSTSYRSTSSEVRQQGLFAHLSQEPESIGGSHCSVQSSKDPPRIDVDFVKEGDDDWLLAVQPGTFYSSRSPNDLTTSNSIPSPATIPSPVSEDVSRRISLDSSSRCSSSARAACTNSNIVINLLRDGTVASGTLEGLVERLINGFVLKRDAEFRDILLSSMVDFVTAEEFFDVIERRFYEADCVTLPHTRDRVNIQHNILSVLSYWVETPCIPLGPELIRRMRNFCENAKSMISSFTMREKADKIVVDLNRNIRAASLPPPTIGPAIPAAQMFPRDLAIGLTLMESDRFKQIHPSDCFMYFGGCPGSNAVETAKKVNLQIVKLVQKSIMHYDDVVKRADVMRFFLNTAKECLELNNFASVVAIATAFKSPLINDLNYSKDQLENSLKQFLRQLLDFISEDYQIYRAEFLGAINQSNAHVPWLAVHLSDFEEILKRHPATFNRNNRTLINFQRYTHFQIYFQEQIPSSLRAYSDLEQFRNAGQLAYVEFKLSGIVLGDEIDAELEARASRLKRSELNEKNRRTVEMKRLGFRQRSRKSS